MPTKTITKKLILCFAFPALGFACSPTATPTSAPISEVNSAPASGEMDHSKMNHDAESSPGAASAPYDLQFLDTMTSHHAGAVEMAKMIADHTNNAELKEFGAQIVAAQDKEIAQMKAWREKWFAGKSPAVNMEMTGMADSMNMDMAKLSAARNADFDVAFVEMMIPHHQGAVEMAQEALKKAEHPEIKTMADQIIKDQQVEIGKMQDWKKAWPK